MERKANLKPPKFKPTYIKAWREVRGLTQKQFVERLDEVVGDVPDDEVSLKVPKTTASLSRIENGEQPYTQATLEAFAVVLDTSAASLIARDPRKEGKVISMIERLGAADLKRAEQVLSAMFGNGTNG